MTARLHVDEIKTALRNDLKAPQARLDQLCHDQSLVDSLFATANEVFVLPTLTICAALGISGLLFTLDVVGAYSKGVEISRQVSGMERGGREGNRIQVRHCPSASASHPSPPISISLSISISRVSSS